MQNQQQQQQVEVMPSPIEIEENPQRKTILEPEPLPEEWNFPLPRILPDPKG